MPVRGVLPYYLIKNVIKCVALTWILIRKNKTMNSLKAILRQSGKFAHELGIRWFYGISVIKCDNNNGFVLLKYNSEVFKWNNMIPRVCYRGKILAKEWIRYDWPAFTVWSWLKCIWSSLYWFYSFVCDRKFS